MTLHLHTRQRSARLQEPGQALPSPGTCGLALTTALTICEPSGLTACPKTGLLTRLRTNITPGGQCSSTEGGEMNPQPEGCDPQQAASSPRACVRRAQAPGAAPALSRAEMVGAARGRSKSHLLMATTEPCENRRHFRHHRLWGGVGDPDKSSELKGVRSLREDARGSSDRDYGCSA